MAHLGAKGQNTGHEKRSSDLKVMIRAEEEEGEETGQALGMSHSRPRTPAEGEVAGLLFSSRPRRVSAPPPSRCQLPWVQLRSPT